MAQLPEKLTDVGNYELWKEQMLNYLKAEGLIGVLEGFDANSSLSGMQKNVRKDRAYLAIKGRLGDEVARHVAGLKTATALMKKLDTLCKKQSLVQLKGIDAMVIEMRKLETQIMQQRGKIHTLNLKLEGMMKEHAQLKSQIDERKMDSYYF